MNTQPDTDLVVQSGPATPADAGGEVLARVAPARPSGGLVVPFDRRRDAMRRYYWSLFSYTGLACAGIILTGWLAYHGPV